MKKTIFTFLLVISALLATPAFAQTGGGFVGKGATIITTVQAAKDARDDTRVRLTGQIVRALGDEKYLFRDASGEIVVEIDNAVWRGQTVSPADKVEIEGEVDRDFMSVEVEVDILRKL